MLNLSNCRLTNDTVAAMARSLQTAPSLKVLNLKRNKLSGGKVMKSLGKMLAAQHGLSELILSENLIKDTLGYLAVTTPDSDRHSQLHVLTEVQAGLEGNTTLKVIDLSWNRIDDTGVCCMWHYVAADHLVGIRWSALLVDSSTTPRYLHSI